MSAEAAAEVRHWTADVNGISLHVAESGPADGPAVLLIHGFPELWLSWRHQMAALAARGFRALAPDLRGYGDSSVPTDPTAYSILHIVGDLVALLDHLRLSKVFVVGHDWGAYVAWHLCLFRPDRVRAAVVLGIPYFPRGPRSMTDSFAALGDGFYINQFQERCVSFHLIDRKKVPITSRFHGQGQFLYERPINNYVQPRQLSCLHHRVPWKWEPGRAERAFARYDVVTVLKKFYALDIDELIAPPGVEIIDFLLAPSSPPPWMTEEELGQYAKKFQKNGFTGPLNYYRMLETNWRLTAPWSGAKIIVPAKFILAKNDVGLQSFGTEKYVKSGGLKSNVPDLEVSIVEGHHFLQQEQAEIVNSEILSFLDKFAREEASA